MDFFSKLFGFAKEQFKSTTSTPVTVFRKIFRYFITGTLFLLPLAITVILITWLGTLIVEYLGPDTYIGSCLKSLGFIYTQDNTEDYTLVSYLVGWLVVLGFILILGSFIEMLSRQWATKFFNRIAKIVKKCTVDLFERMMNSIPAVGMVYKSSRQLVNMVDKNDSANNMKGMAPVYCRFGGTIVLALLTSPVQQMIKDKPYYAVIIPTAPIPFGGAIIMVPVEDVWTAEMKMDEFLAFYASMGVVNKEGQQIEK